jgi:transmembrane sensor
MEKQTPQQLIDKYLSGKATPDEVATLESWYLQRGAKMKDVLPDPDYALVENELWPVIAEQTLPRRKEIRLWQRIAVAAAAVAAIVFGVWFFNVHMNGRHPELGSGSPNYANDVAPGKNTATLTLANGQTISLSDAKTGVIVGADKLSYNDGTVVDPSLRGGTTRQPPFGDEVAASRSAPRNDGLGARNDKVQMLTAATPRGGQYQITLPDGTRVWLNADSKISFPAQFIGKERKVLLLNGEVYFEVTKNKRMPFIVESKGQQIEVLGTHFNISAYSDEISTKTTLLEGSVRVSSLRGPNPSLRGGTTRQSHDEVATARAELGSVSRRAPRNDDRNNDEWAEGRGGKMEILKPGEQAIVTGNNRIDVKQVDVNDAIAWKAGKFVFDTESIESIMRKVARWYNVAVIYPENEMGAKIKQQTFSGSVNRFDQVSTLLRKIEMTNTIHFKIEGRRISIMP